jgi:hypothetical protein
VSKSLTVNANIGLFLISQLVCGSPQKGMTKAFILGIYSKEAETSIILQTL